MYLGQQRTRGDLLRQSAGCPAGIPGLKVRRV